MGLGPAGPEGLTLEGHKAEVHRTVSGQIELGHNGNTGQPEGPAQDARVNKTVGSSVGRSADVVEHPFDVERFGQG